MSEHRAEHDRAVARLKNARTELKRFTLTMRGDNAQDRLTHRRLSDNIDRAYLDLAHAERMIANHDPILP
jgi:hypothetical protein